MSKKEGEDGKRFVDRPITLKNLQEILDYYFSERIRDFNPYILDIPSLIVQYNITMKELVEDIEKVKDFLPEIERDILKDEILEDIGKLTQTGVLRVILTLTNDSCWEIFEKNFERDKYFFNIPQKVFETRKKWRKIIKEGKKWKTLKKK